MIPSGLPQATRKPLRILYSFPQRLGAGRICATAWQQVVGASAAGGCVKVFAGSVERVTGTENKETLRFGRLKIPLRILGRRGAGRIHDWRVARWLSANSSEVDVVHCWPLACLATIRAAKSAGIPVLLERPNAHTAFAYEEVAKECAMLGLQLPQGHDHEENPRTLEREESEYREADFLLCPSDFVARTFIERGFSADKLLRHRYGHDLPAFEGRAGNLENRGLQMVYAGVCEPRKGLHYALKAWLESSASATGRFMVCGEFVPGYAEKLDGMLNHPSVEVMGHRRDLPEIMRRSDLFVLSSIEEGSALVSYEARASGCVILVSDRVGAVCNDGIDGLIHPARNVDVLRAHMDLLDSDRRLLSKLAAKSLATASELTWKKAGVVLLDRYHEALKRKT